MVSPERIYDLEPGEDIQSVPRLLVPWSSRTAIFFGNLRDLIFPRPKPRLLVTSAPGIFWKDVFVERPLAKRFIFDSYALHALAVLAVYFVFSSPLFWNQRLPSRDPYTHTTIEYYSVSEYLPPMRSAARPTTHSVKGEPAYAKQEIISVPPEPDNSTQTIVTPDVKLITKHVPLPNMMAWKNEADPIQPLAASADLNPHPKLFTPPDIIAPAPDDVPRSRRDLQFQQAVVVRPAPEDLPNSHRRLPVMEADVVKPAPELPAGARSRMISPVQPSVIEPPPTPDGLRRSPGAMNVGKLSPSVSEPKLPVTEQRASLGSAGGGGAASAPAASAQPQAPPPPSAQGLGNSRGSGQLIALSAQPAPVLGPIEVPRGSRRGVFAAGPSGTLGAPGTPNIEAKPSDNTASSGASGNAAGATATSNHVPEGIYVGGGPSAPATGTVVAPGPPAAAPKPEPTLRDKLLGLMRGASADIPRTPPPPAPPKPEGETKIEDKVFGEKRYYSMILNMPNLNSSVGSWIVRFAELKPTKEQAELSAPVALNKVDPAYPAELIRDRVEGTVVLYAVIRADGVVDNVRVLQSVDDRLDKSAMSALRRWHFRPGTKQGAAIDIEAVVQIPFRVAKLKN